MLRSVADVPPIKVSSKGPVFDVKLFLDSAGLGRKIKTFRGKETIFTQGDPAKESCTFRKAA
jgi:hypothetical protein